MSQIFDKGSGVPLVVIPGVQGRWEWMAPAVDALSRRCRAISYSLAPAETFSDLLAQLDGILDERGLRRAAICGVSFGGRVAVAYAATRPERTGALVIVSTPGPSWQPSPVQAGYLQRPWRSTPSFVASSPGRLWPEISSAIPGLAARARFSVGHVLRIVTAPIVPAEMAARMQLPLPLDLAEACRRVTAPTLIVTGEPALDQVVPAASTREFASLIAGAKYEMMKGTGHIGLVTQPDRFAEIAGTFVNAASS
jgi:3-oxoadipate enol-lactonase